MKNPMIRPLAIWLVLGAAGSAHALDFTIANAPGTNFGFTIDSPAYNGAPGGGSFLITTNSNGGAWPSNVPASFLTYCVDLYQQFGYGSMSGYSILAPTSAANGNPGISLAQLDRIGRLMTYAYGSNGFGPSVTDSQANAIQAGIWEIVYEPTATAAGFDLGSGNYKLSAAFTSSSDFGRVNSWMGSGGVATDLLSYQQYAVLYSPTQQDFLVPVPEPEAYGLALAGMGVVAFAKLRRRVDHKQA